MLLKEFELDLSYRPNEEYIQNLINRDKVSIEEAKKIDYENNWKQLRRKFALETRCITSMFERLLPKCLTKNTRKIVVEITDRIVGNEMWNGIGVYHIQIIENLDSFFSLDEYEKKKLALELLFKGVSKVVEKENLNYLEFEKIYFKIKELKYKNEWKYGKYIKNNEKTASLICEHNTNSMDIKIIVKSDKINFEKIIFSEIPDERIYSKKLGKLVWKTQESMLLIDNYGNCIKEIDVKN